MKKGNYTVEGRVHRIIDEEIESKKKPGEVFPKRTYILEVPVEKGIWERTSYAVFEVFGQRAFALEHVNTGDDVEINFRIDSRSWIKDGQDKWITTLKLEDLTKVYQKYINEPVVEKEDAFDYSELIPKQEKKQGFDDDGNWIDNGDDLPF